MDYKKFYKDLYEPLERELGPVDRNTIFAIIGFDVGGPLNFCTIGAESGCPEITYISCELACREEQKPSENGRFELMMICDDEKFVRGTLTSIGRMSMNARLGHGHTIDIGPIVEPNCVIQAILLERAYSTIIDDKPYCILRTIGITRSELDYARNKSKAKLVECLKHAGIYPNTNLKRQSVV